MQEWGIWTCLKKCVAGCAKKRGKKDQEIREPLVDENGVSVDDTEHDLVTDNDSALNLHKQYENPTVVNSLLFLDKMEEEEEEEVVGWMQEEPPAAPLDTPPPPQFAPVGEVPDVIERAYRSPKYASSKKVVLTKIDTEEK
jgi:hypothetical protein